MPALCAKGGVETPLMDGETEAQTRGPPTPGCASHPFQAPALLGVSCPGTLSLSDLAGRVDFRSHLSIWQLY